MRKERKTEGERNHGYSKKSCTGLQKSLLISQLKGTIQLGLEIRGIRWVNLWRMAFIWGDLNQQNKCFSISASFEF